MKTAEEKAEQWLKQNIPYGGLSWRDELVLLLKEQDRDTRHACAQSLDYCDPVYTMQYKCGIYNSREAIVSNPIDADQAWSAIMNVKAV